MSRKRRNSPEKPKEAPKGSPVFNRRNFLIASAVAAVGEGAYLLLRNQQSYRSKLQHYPSPDMIRQTQGLHPDVRSFLESFPVEKLAKRDSVSDIRIRTLDKAKHLLIHIFQMHDMYGGTRGRANAEVRTVQNNIYDILRFSADDSSVRLQEVFMECLLVTDENTLNDQIGIVRRGIAEPNHDQLEANAAMRVAVNRGTRMRGADDAAIVAENQRWVAREAERGKLTPEEYREVERIFNAREDFLLSHLDNERQRIHVVVYGGLHDFADNIEKWNQTHPDDEFGLMNISPTK